MEIEKARKQILEIMGINEKGVDLFDRVNVLEKIDKNISFIERGKSTIDWAKVSTIVHLKENFAGMDEFKKYAEEKGLEGTLTVQTGEKVHYLIYNEGVEIEFYSL